MKIEIVVCGGAALNAMGLVQRVTSDVDVLGILEHDGIPTIRRADFPESQET